MYTVDGESYSKRGDNRLDDPSRGQTSSPVFSLLFCGGGLVFLHAPPSHPLPSSPSAAVFFLLLPIPLRRLPLHPLPLFFFRQRRRPPVCRSNMGAELTRVFSLPPSQSFHRPYKTPTIPSSPGPYFHTVLHSHPARALKNSSPSSSSSSPLPPLFLLRERKLPFVPSPSSSIHRSIPLSRKQACTPSLPSPA